MLALSAYDIGCRVRTCRQVAHVWTPVDKKIDSSLIFIDHVSLQSELMAADVCTTRLEWPDLQIETLIDLLQKTNVCGRRCLIAAEFKTINRIVPFYVTPSRPIIGSIKPWINSMLLPDRTTVLWTVSLYRISQWGVQTLWKNYHQWRVWIPRTTSAVICVWKFFIHPVWGLNAKPSSAYATAWVLVAENFHSSFSSSITLTFCTVSVFFSFW